MKDQKFPVETPVKNSEIDANRATCKFCQENPCGCPRELKKIRIELEEKEERHRYILISYRLDNFASFLPYILQHLPQYKLARYIYLSMGGRQNLIPAALISTNIAQLIFHNFFPRLIWLLWKRKIWGPIPYPEEIILHILVTGSMSIYFIWGKLKQREIYKLRYQKMLENRDKKIDEIRNFSTLDKNIVNRFIEHIENKLCFTHPEFKHNQFVMSGPKLCPSTFIKTLPKATEPLHMITTESKMAHIDSVFAFVKNSQLNTNSSFWKITSKMNCKEFKKFSQESLCVIL